MKQHNFVAINFIECQQEYKQRFEELFTTRAHAIDTMPGFKGMEVLKPTGDGANYLVVSYWETEESFKQWTGSQQFLEGHKRGFEDIAKARQEGRTPPMVSTFKTYSVLTQ